MELGPGGLQKIKLNFLLDMLSFKKESLPQPYISKWIKEVIGLAGFNANTFKVYSSRSVSSVGTDHKMVQMARNFNNKYFQNRFVVLF